VASDDRTKPVSAVDKGASEFGGVTRYPFSWGDEKQSAIDAYESGGLDSVSFYKELEEIAMGDSEEETAILPTNDIVIDGVTPVDEKTEVESKGRELSVRLPKAPWQIIYGETRVQGNVTFVTTDINEGGNWLHIIDTYAGHQVHGVDEIFIDGVRFTWLDQDIGTEIGDGKFGFYDWAFPGTVTPEVFLAYASAFVQSRGHPDQPANSDAVGQSSVLFPGKWTAVNRQRNRALAYLILYFNANRYPNGYPEIFYEVRGRQCYDPRLDSSRQGTGTHRYNDPDTWTYTNNAALCINNYLMTSAEDSYGLGVDYDAQIDEDTLIEAADICDETILVDVSDKYSDSGYARVWGSGQTGSVIKLHYWQPYTRVLQSGQWLKFGTEYYQVEKSAITDGAGQVYVKLTRTLVASPPNAQQVEVYESRYTINGVFDSDQSYQDVLRTMAGCIAGFVAYTNGQWIIMPGAWRTPTVEITLREIISGIDVRTQIDIKDSFNAIKGTYKSPEQNWEETDYPAITNATYQDQDGRQIWREKDYPLTVFGATAQRISKIALEKIRQGIQVSIVCKLSAYQLRVGDNVQLTLDRYGWSQKEFEVVNTQLALNNSGGAPTLGVALTLRETAEGVFDWAGGSETQVDLAPNTDLPSPNVVVNPTNLQIFSGTAELYKRLDGTIFSAIRATWDIPTDPISQLGKIEIQYKRSADPDWQDATPVPATQTWTRLLDVQDGDYYDVRIRTVNAIGVRSLIWETVANHLVLGKSAPPSDVSVLYATVNKYGILLQWSEVTDIDVKEYEIREGATWETGTAIASKISATTYTWGIQTAGTYNFWIKAIDTSGNYSTNATPQTAVIPAPPSPVITSQIVGGDVFLNWENIVSLFAIDEYEISYGPTWAGSIPLANIKGTKFTDKVEWGDDRLFWVAARDVAGNLGTPGSTTVSIQTPSAVVNLNSAVSNNNVFLNWEIPAQHTVPIEKYKIKKGDVYATTEELVDNPGTFFTYFELTGGTYRYWVVAIDSAGNEGTPNSVQTNVSDPDNFILRDDQYLDPEDALLTVNVEIDEENDCIISPQNITETWSEHFVNNGWSTIQDQVDAGYPIYSQPTPGYGMYIQVVDFGAVLPATIVSFSYLETVIAGSVSKTITLAASDNGVDWVIFPENELEVLASNFRYIRLIIVFGTVVHEDGEAMGPLGLTYTGETPADDTSITKLCSMRLVLKVQKTDDEGRGNATISGTNPDSTDIATYGNQVDFNRSFVDIVTIVTDAITPLGTQRYTNLLYDLASAPADQKFYVKLLDESGVRVTGEFTWKATGIIVS